MAAKAIFKSVCGLTIAIAFTACGGNGIEGENGSNPYPVWKLKCKV